MKKSPITVSITGPAGAIGYALLPRIASGQMFGPDQPVRLQLIELPQALDALKGVVMELQDCAFPLLDSIVITSDLNEGFKDADWALLIGAVPRKKGMERSDLLGINAKIFSAQGAAINANAKKSVKTLVVGNPCNTNALITMHHAPDIDRSQFFAMTLLDENRALAQLALRSGATVDNIETLIWGNHSSTLYPDIDNGTIDGKPVRDAIGDDAWLEGEFIELIQKRGAAIIEARGASSAFSAANGVIDTVQALCGQKGDSLFSVALYSNGEYGAEPGLIVSYPCRYVDGDIVIQEGVSHGEFGQAKIKATFDELAAEAQAVRSLNLLS